MQPTGWTSLPRDRQLTDGALGSLASGRGWALLVITTLSLDRPRPMKLLFHTTRSRATARVCQRLSQDFHGTDVHGQSAPHRWIAVGFIHVDAVSTWRPTRREVLTNMSFEWTRAHITGRNAGRPLSVIKLRPAACRPFVETTSIALTCGSRRQTILLTTAPCGAGIWTIGVDAARGAPRPADAPWRMARR